MFHLEQWLHPDLASPIGSKFRGKPELERVNNVQKPLYLTVHDMKQNKNFFSAGETK
jgi:hypothetical protein